MNGLNVATSAGERNSPDEVNPTFTPFKIGADGSRTPYSPANFEELRADLLAGAAAVVMNNVNLLELYAKHHREDDPTAYYDNAQPEYVGLLEAAAATDPELSKLWLDVWGAGEMGLCLSGTATGQPELIAATIDEPRTVDSVLTQIREQKKIRYEQQKRSDPHVVERYRRRNSVSDRQMHDAILAGMSREPDRKHAKHELEAYAEMAGLSYRAVPFHLTCMVAQGKIERVHYGWYRLPQA